MHKNTIYIKLTFKFVP